MSQSSSLVQHRTGRIHDGLYFLFFFNFSQVNKGACSSKYPSKNAFCVIDRKCTSSSNLTNRQAAPPLEVFCDTSCRACTTAIRHSRSSRTFLSRIDGCRRSSKIALLAFRSGISCFPLLEWQSMYHRDWGAIGCLHEKIVLWKQL